jgi:rod shape-determining protein MreC
VQHLAQLPRSLSDHAATYLQGLHNLQQENAASSSAPNLNTAPNLQRTRQQLEVENERLRKLLSVKERAESQWSGRPDSLHGARPFSRKVIVDKGQQDRHRCRAAGD